MNSPSLNTPYLVLSGIVIIAISSVFFVYQPMMDDIGGLRESIERDTVKVQERENFLRTIDRKLSELQGQQQHEERLNVMLPVEDRMEDMLRIIHQSAQTSGVVVNALTDQSGTLQSSINAQRARGENVQLPSGVRPLAVEIAFTGTYQQFRAFMTELEKSPRLIDTSHITLRRNDQAPDNVSGSMQMTFYAQQAPSLADEL